MTCLNDVVEAIRATECPSAGFVVSIAPGESMPLADELGVPAWELNGRYFETLAGPCRFFVDHYATPRSGVSAMAALTPRVEFVVRARAERKRRRRNAKRLRDAS